MTHNIINAGKEFTLELTLDYWLILVKDDYDIPAYSNY